MKQFVMDGWVTNGRIDRRKTATGREVVSFSVNSPSRRKNQEGEWENVPQFFDCKYWSRSERDFRMGLIEPGMHLVLSGEPTYEEWQDHEGNKRSKTVFVARDVWPVAQQGQAAPQQTPEQAYEEDIPF